MRKTKLISSVLGVIAFAASAVVAHAGGGGEGLPGGAVFYTCYVIYQGANPPHVLTVNDQFSDAHDIQVGQAKLLCTQATGTFVSGTENPTPDSDHLTCYDTNDRTDSRALVELQDSFGVQQVLLGKPRYVCTGSTKTCLNEGCPVLDAPSP